MAQQVQYLHVNNITVMYTYIGALSQISISARSGCAVRLSLVKQDLNISYTTE